jgi:hypothetical protein
MALIVPIHGQMSGSIGDNVFSHNKGGPYVRRRAIPINPSTTRQTTVRSNLSTVARAWRTLTAGQRAAWNVWAPGNPVINRLGQSIQLSGFGCYCRLNGSLRDAGSTAITNPPTTQAPASLATVSCTGNTSSSVTLAYTATPLAGGTKLALWSSGPLSAAQDPNLNQARLVGYTAAAAASPQTLNLPFAVTTGDVLNLWVSLVDAYGRTTPPVKIRYTCT